MGPNKKISNNIVKLFQETEYEIQDRKLVEDLKNRLHKLISNDLQAQKKAATILTLWLGKNQKK